MNPTGGRTTSLLRPALEAALRVAREGSEEDPPVPVPPPLQPLVKFTRFSRASLEAVRRSLEDLDDFRQRVAESVSEDEVGRAGWLFLARPAGWRRELEEIGNRAVEEESRDQDRRRHQDLVRQVAQGERTEARLRAERDALADELAQLRSDLRDQRSSRSRIGSRLEEVERQLEAADRRGREASRRLAEVEAELDRARGQTADGTDLTEAQGLAAQLEGARRHLSELRARGQTVGGLLERSRRQAEELVEWLERAISALGPDFGDDGRPPVVVPEAPVVASPPPPRPHRRRPAPLPPGLRDDQPEAVASLLRLPGAVLLVDGYNVSMAGWPASELSDQRARLVRELDGLAARTGAEVRVVFDGSDEVADPAPNHPRRGVAVSFTATDVEADDVIVELIGAFDPARVVVVASGDRQVQSAAEQAGANVVSAHQLLAALDRR